MINEKASSEQSRRIRAHILVSGFVQRVFFRSYTKNTADTIGVFGWVQNLADGRVEAMLEGEKEKVEKMVEWMKKGPPAAKIDNVEIEYRECKNEFGNFDIKYN